MHALQGQHDLILSNDSKPLPECHQHVDSYGLFTQDTKLYAHHDIVIRRDIQQRISPLQAHSAAAVLMGGPFHLCRLLLYCLLLSLEAFSERQADCLGVRCFCLCCDQPSLLCSRCLLPVLVLSQQLQAAGLCLSDLGF